MVAFQTALQHPDRVQSLTIGATPYRSADLAVARTLAGLSPEAFAKRMLEMCLTPKGQADPELVAELTTSDSAQRRRPDGAIGARRTAALFQHDMTGRTNEISAPTLLIYGREDPMAPPEIGQRLNKEIRGSRLVIQEDARHSFFREHPSEVAKLVSDWVLSHPIGIGADIARI
jgi:3-oxoadipate enol-lactonase